MRPQEGRHPRARASEAHPLRTGRLLIQLDDIRGAAARLRGVVRPTPVMSSESLSRRFGSRLLVKGEHLQRTGSFKIRGAYNCVAGLPQDARDRGVVAASAGNHGQGVAWAATKLAVDATIVMPAYASLPKVEATRAYGAKVELHGETFDDALARARAIVDERGATLVHAFDDPRVIAGQGTLGLELAAEVSDADLVLIAVGGGGLVAGTAIALKALAPAVRIVGVRAASSPATIADGAAVAGLGSLTAPVIERLVDEVVEVDDEAVSEAIVLHLERCKQVVEGAGALPLAALVSGRVRPEGTTVLVASGGNIDPGLLARVIRHGLGTAGRYLFVRVRLRDRPGELQRVLSLLASQRANVVSVVHHRVGLVLPVEQVEVELTLETRDRAHADAVLQALRDAGFEPLA